MKNYDVVIIGSGPGGYVAGIYAARHKLKTCVIEKDLVGGTCLNRGCIPTKAMLNSASLLSRIKESAVHGIEVSAFNVNFARIVNRKDEVVSKLRSSIETLFKANKIDLIKGEAILKDGNQVRVGPEDIGAKFIIIASGSRPSGLPGIQFDERAIFSSDGIVDIKELPKSILIVGGGVIGCEFANLFNGLGAKVTIVELLDRIVITQSREASKKLEVIFKKRGIDVFTSCKAESVAIEMSRIKARLSNGQDIEAEKALVAVGRTPNVSGLGLEGVGIGLEKGRIRVDENLRTDVKNIFAIGDCVRGPLLAHKASYDAIVACDNILGTPRRADYSNIPNCIYTEPEIASVGLTEEEARTKFPGSRTAKFPYLASGKALIMGKQEGYIKIVGAQDGTLLGVEIFGEEACDLIGEATLARATGLNIKDLAHAVHCHPTLSEIFQEAAHSFLGSAIHSI